MKTNIKAKNGKSFPDLNKDGKITKADILKGRGVIAQNGKKMQGVKGMSENEKLKKGITKLAPVKDKPVKKAALGALLPLAMKAAPMVAGMLGGKGKGKSGGIGGMLGGLMGKNGKTVKKAQNGAKTADSTAYFDKKATKDVSNALKTLKEKGTGKEYNKAYNTQMQSLKSLRRQANKGKKGYDENGFPIKMKMGGTIKKAQTGNAIIDKASKDYKSYSAGTGPKPPLSSGFKNGGSTKKCKYGCK